MSADKAIAHDDLDAERVIRLQNNIYNSKKEFIKNQAQLGVLEFLVEARQKLDVAEARMQSQLHNRRSSLFSFFSNSNKVAPNDAANTITAEFETARRLLLEIHENILNQADETNLKQRAVHYSALFEVDLRKLKDGQRLEKTWNNTNEIGLFPEEVEERQVLGKISNSNSKIFSILNEIDDELAIFPLRVKEFLKNTNARVDEVVEKQVDIAFKEFAASAFGKYVVNWLELQKKTAQQQAKGIPPHIIDKNLKKLIQKTEAAKKGVNEAELRRMEDIKKFHDLSKVNILIIVLPDVKFSGLIQAISNNIHFKEKSVEPKDIASHYRRKTG